VKKGVKNTYKNREIMIIIGTRYKPGRYPDEQTAPKALNQQKM